MATLTEWPTEEDWKRWAVGPPTDAEMERLEKELGAGTIMDGDEVVGLIFPKKDPDVHN